MEAVRTGCHDQQLFETLPQIADAVAQPLAKTDSIVVISNAARTDREPGPAR